MKSRTNYLVEPIRSLLKGYAGPISEYDLMQVLQQQGWLEPLKAGDPLSLYSLHFLLYNALFQLNQELEEGQSLFISAMAIALLEPKASSVHMGNDSKEHSVAHADPSSNQANSLELSSYYLDWSNLDQATESSVDELLNSFWQRFVNDDEYTLALQRLGVEPEASYADIKQQYKRLAMESHPDRGGKAEDFQAINHAFSLVRRRFS